MFAEAEIGRAAARALLVGVSSRVAVSRPAGHEIRICMATFNNLLNFLARGTPAESRRNGCAIMLVNVNAFTSVSCFLPFREEPARQTARCDHGDDKEKTTWT
ncbi:hypothetical protein Slala03_31190 [Streptomyces lavendulae subsp. lavendulae]|nr:hypothetical protein Slala03_31190 [Streptomyces lavendulae subsp. lavendulae]GLX34713.1 hypothetical protein Sros01_07860 [Streptomyces roseochromogenus]